jgi:hypothetical protein
MQFVRKLALVACTVSSLAIGVNFAQAAPGLGQAAPSVLSTEVSPGTGPFVQKAWWHHCWHCGWGWHHHYWHRWHHW